MAKSTSQQIINNSILHISCLIIGALILVRDVGDISYNKFILLTVCCLPMLLLNYSNFLCLLSFLFALTFGIPSNFIYVIAAVVLVLKTKDKIPNSVLAMFAVFAIWAIFDNMIYDGVFGASFWGYVTRLFLLFALINADNKEIDYNKAVSLFAIGVVITSIAIIGLFLKTNSLDNMINFGTRLGDSSTYIDEGETQGMKMNTNANNLACYCICAMGCCINVFMKSRKPLWAIMFFLLFGLGMLTVSRTFIVIGVGMIFAYIFMASKGNLPWYIKILFIVISGIAIFFFLQSDFVSLFGNRFNNESWRDDSRGDIFMGYWDAFWSDPASIFIGAGVFTHRDLLFHTQSTHNMFQQILVSYGFAGFLIFVYYLTKTFATSYTNIVGIPSMKKAALITIIATLLYQQTIQYLAPHDLMLPTVIGMFALNNIKYNTHYKV